MKSKNILASIEDCIHQLDDIDEWLNNFHCPIGDARESLESLHEGIEPNRKEMKK